MAAAEKLSAPGGVGASATPARTAIVCVISSLLNELKYLQGLSFNRVTLRLNGIPRTLEFPVPVRDSKVVLKQLQVGSGRRTFAAGCCGGVGVVVESLPRRGFAAWIVYPAGAGARKIAIDAGALDGGSCWGKDNVGLPGVGTHRPDAFVMRGFSSRLGPGLRRGGAKRWGFALRFDITGLLWRRRCG